MTISIPAESTEQPGSTRPAAWDPFAETSDAKQVFAATSRLRSLSFRIFEALVAVALLGLLCVLVTASLGMGGARSGVLFSRSSGANARAATSAALIGGGGSPDPLVIAAHDSAAAPSILEPPPADAEPPAPEPQADAG